MMCYFRVRQRPPSNKSDLNKVFFQFCGREVQGKDFNRLGAGLRVVCPKRFWASVCFKSSSPVLNGNI